MGDQPGEHSKTSFQNDDDGSGTAKYCWGERIEYLKAQSFMKIYQIQSKRTTKQWSWKTEHYPFPRCL